MANKIYAVKRGRKTGLFQSWDEASKQVNGYAHAEYKSFKNQDDANQYLKQPLTLPNQDTTKAVNNNEALSPSDYDVTMYTDGGCRLAHNYAGASINQNDVSAWAYQIKTNDTKYAGTNAYKGFSNNQMELTAVIFGLRKLKSLGLQNQKLLLVSDSQYVLNPIKSGNLQKWSANNWSKDIKNKAYWQEINSLLPEFKHLDFTWTKGHATNLGNNYVDHLLNRAMDELTIGTRSLSKSPTEEVQPIQSTSSSSSLLQDLDASLQSSTSNKSKLTAPKVSTDFSY